MSCCLRTNAPATPRPGGHDSRPSPLQAAPAVLRFTGRSALSLPLGTGRLLVHPSQQLTGLGERERSALWRTGLFEAG